MDTLVYDIDDRRYVNLGNRCTLRCAFCPKFHDSWQLHEFDLRMKREASVDEYLQLLQEPAQYREIVFCGFGEPTLRLPALRHLARHVHEGGGRVRVNTDGLASLVHGRDVVPELVGIVDACSVSLNAQDEPTYIRHCRPPQAGAFDAVQGFIRTASRHGLEVTATAINGLDDVDIGACRLLAERLGARFRERQLDVLG